MQFDQVEFENWLRINADQFRDDGWTVDEIVRMAIFCRFNARIVANWKMTQERTKHAGH